jgi:hypothetical protein
MDFARALRSDPLRHEGVRPFNIWGLRLFWLYATFMLISRRSGYVILALASLLAAGMPILHLSGKGVGGAIAASSGGYFFVWTLFALGVTGTFSLILAMRGLWRLRRGQPAA